MIRYSSKIKTIATLLLLLMIYIYIFSNDINSKKLLENFKLSNSKNVIVIAIVSCGDRVFNNTVTLLRSIALLSRSYVKIFIVRDSLDDIFQKEVIIEMGVPSYNGLLPQLQKTRIFKNR